MRALSAVQYGILAYVACAAITPHTLSAAETSSEQPGPSVTIVGKFVLPKEVPAGVLIENVRIGKLTGTVRRQAAEPELPYPEGYENFSPDEQRAWIKQFLKSPESLAYLPAFLAFKARQDSIPPMPIQFAGDGSFEVKGLQAGKWFIEARIPHDTVESLSHATFMNVLSVTGSADAVDLGELPLALRPALAPGDMAPDFTASTYDGKAFRLSDYRGKFVLLDFWATWCMPCVAELPNLEAVHKDFAGDRFEMIALSLDETIDDAKAFEEQHPSAYVHGYAGERSKSVAYGLYGVQMIPSIWLIGPDGRIIARDLRGADVREAVKKALDGLPESN